MSLKRTLGITVATVRLRQGADIQDSLLLIPICAKGGQPEFFLVNPRKKTQLKSCHILEQHIPVLNRTALDLTEK